MPHMEHIRRQTDGYSSVSPLCLFPWYKPGTTSWLIQLWNNKCDFERGLTHVCCYEPASHRRFLMLCREHEWDIYKVIACHIKDTRTWRTGTVTGEAAQIVTCKVNGSLCPFQRMMNGNKGRFICKYTVTMVLPSLQHKGGRIDNKISIPQILHFSFWRLALISIGLI